MSGSAGDLYVAGFSDTSSKNPEVMTFAGAPFTEQWRNTNGSAYWPAAFADAIVAGGGSQTAKWTLGDAPAWGAAIAAYKAA